MKKVKKVLTLFLTLAMLLSMLCISTFAVGPMGPMGGMGPGMGSSSSTSTGASSSSDFADLSSIKHIDAVSLLVSLGVINGIAANDGTVNYQPDGNLTRGQMAKLVATAATLISDADISGTSSFSDSATHWAADYINFCADGDIIDGVGGGLFQPDGTVTGYQTAKMLLAAMGVSGLTGSDWQNETKLAEESKGLFAEITADMSNGINRDDAAQMLYNALMSNDGTGILPQVICVNKSASYDSLTIGANTLYCAPEGKKAVLTVDGVNQPLKPGCNYAGSAQISVVNAIEDTYTSHGSSTPQHMTAGLSVNESGILADESVTAALNGVTYDGTSAKGGTIVSKDTYFGGIRVSGTANYTVDGVTVDLTGNGGNDFTGIGAGFAVVDNATLTVKNCHITTLGALRSALFSGDNAKLIVEDTTITTGTVYNADGSIASVSIPTAGMSSPPTGLGVAGNCRSLNQVDSANAYYYRCTVNADAWGAMGTDDVEGTAADPVELYMEDCNINVAHSGYGAYAIGYIWDNFNGCTINADNGMGVIVAAEGSTKLYNGTVINSNRFGIVTHQGMGAVSNIVVTGKGTVVNAKYTGIEIKGRATNIEISDGAVLNVTDGALIQAVVNDDTGAGSLQGTETITAAVNNTGLNGDIVDSLPAVPMTLTMSGATLSGAITTTSSYTYQNGGTVTDAQDVGIVTQNVFGDLENATLNVAVTNGSVWTVTTTSYLDSLTIDATSTVKGVITVNGAAVTAPGTYTGAIVVAPAGSAATK